MIILAIIGILALIYLSIGAVVVWRFKQIWKNEVGLGSCIIYAFIWPIFFAFSRFK
jgi:hypothetical protein